MTAVVVLCFFVAAAISGAYLPLLATLGLGSERKARVWQLEHRFRRQVQPILEQNCLACHGVDKAKGEVALHRFDTLASVQKERATWKRVALMLHQRLMPPKKRKQRPTQQQYELVSTWVDDALAYVDCCGSPDPGRVTIRRLNRREYNHTIRDLVGVDIQPADDFPADDTGYGFDNIGDVLSISTLLAEKYLATAERVMDAAIVTEKVPPPSVKHYRALSMRATTGEPARAAYNLTKEGEVYTKHEFPATGEYIIRVRAWGEQAGDEVVRMAVRLDQTTLAEFEVATEANEPGTYETRFTASKGKHRVAAAFLNNFN